MRTAVGATWSRLNQRFALFSKRDMGTGGDIEETPVPVWKGVHQRAMDKGDQTYIDPATGYTVFTELSHRDRGYCCGNACRHCPFEHDNVGKPEQLKQQARVAREARKQARKVKKEE